MPFVQRAHTTVVPRRPSTRLAAVAAALLLACDLAATQPPDARPDSSTTGPDTTDGRRITPFPSPSHVPDGDQHDVGLNDASSDFTSDTRETNPLGTGSDAIDGNSSSDTARANDIDRLPDEAPLDARPDTNSADTDTDDTTTNIDACPESVTAAAIDCVTERMTAPDTVWTGGWTEAAIACATDSRTRRSLDDACRADLSPRWCMASGVGNHGVWVDACAWQVDYRIRDSLCVFETRWDESVLTGRVLERHRQILSSSQMAAAADSAVWAQALRVRWPDVERAATGFQRVDPGSVATAVWWDLTNDRSWEALTYRVAGQTWGAIIDADRTIGAQIRSGITEACRAAEGIGARPCRDNHCGDDRTCVGERDQLAGLCVDPTFEPDYVDCRTHTDCPVGFMCLPADTTVECRPAWTRRVVSSWLDRALAPDGTMRTAITMRGLAPVGEQVAIWLHLNRPLPWNAEVWLMDPDGRPSVVPWTSDWTGWVPLPHAAAERDRNGTWQLEIQLPADGLPVLVEGWSLRVDSRGG